MNKRRMMKKGWFSEGVLIVCVAGLLGVGCSTIAEKKASPLRVGVTPDYAPLVMKRGGDVVGLEVELGLLLGAQLGRPVQFFPLKWREQFDALLDGRTDIIMSGISMTRERELRVQFTEPYMKNAVMGMVRQRDAEIFQTKEDILQFTGNIGAKAGTTADVFVQKHCLKARRVSVADPELAVYELKRKRIDLFLDDGHSIAWQVSKNEGDVSGVWIPLTEEYIAWAVRRTDTAFASKVNAVLQIWKRNGRLKAELDRWLPYSDRVEVPVGVRPAFPLLEK